MKLPQHHPHPSHHAQAGQAEVGFGVSGRLSLLLARKQRPTDSDYLGEHPAQIAFVGVGELFQVRNQLRVQSQSDLFGHCRFALICFRWFHGYQR